MDERLNAIESRLDAIEANLADLPKIRALLETIISQRAVKDAYTTAEVAELVGRPEYQVRTWCQQGRIEAVKADSGHGLAKGWKIPHAAIEHYRSHGLLPAAERLTAASR